MASYGSYIRDQSLDGAVYLFPQALVEPLSVSDKVMDGREDKDVIWVILRLESKQQVVDIVDNEWQQLTLQGNSLIGKQGAVEEEMFSTFFLATAAGAQWASYDM